MRRQRASRQNYAETLDLYSTREIPGPAGSGPQVHSDGSSAGSSPPRPSSSLAVRTGAGDGNEGDEEQEGQDAGSPAAAAAAAAAPASPSPEWESAASTGPSTPSPVSTQGVERRHVEFIDVEYLEDIELDLPAFDGAYRDNDITPPSIRRLVERESSPVEGLSPRHAVSRRRLARFRDRTGERERERIEVFIAGNESEGKESDREALVG